MDDLQERMQRAMDGIRRYHEARDSLNAAEEVDRLRLELEPSMQAVTDYQLRALGGEGVARN